MHNAYTSQGVNHLCVQRECTLKFLNDVSKVYVSSRQKTGWTDIKGANLLAA